MSKILKNLQNLINKAQDGGGKDRIASQHKKGNLSARERINILLDEHLSQ